MDTAERAIKRDSDVWESEPSSASTTAQEAIALASHAQHLTRNCLKAQVSLSLPRMRPAAGEFEQVEFLPDHQFVQLIAALRLLVPKLA